MLPDAVQDFGTIPVMPLLCGRCGDVLDAMSVDDGFRKPLFLPSTVTLSTARAGEGWDLAVRNAKSGTEHLVGTARPL